MKKMLRPIQKLKAQVFPKIQLSALEPWDRAAFFLCFGFMLFWFSVLLDKYVNFGYYDWDLAIIAQTLNQIMAGNLKPSIYNTIFLTNHADYFAFLLAPIYALCPHPMSLIILKILAFVSGSYIFYLTAKRLLDGRMAFIILVLYLAYPPNIFMLLFEFTYENIATVMTFLLFYFFIEKKLKPFLICCFIASLIKENIALMIAMFGIMAFVNKNYRQKGWVLGPLGIGSFIFCFSIFFLMPAMRQALQQPNANQYWSSLYLTPLAPTAAPLPKFLILLQPLRNLFDVRALEYLTHSIMPFGLFPLLTPSFLVPIIPLILQHLLSNSPPMKSIYYHYFATLTPALFIATAYSLMQIKKLAHKNIFFLFAAILCFTHLSWTFLILPQQPLLDRIAVWHDHLSPYRWAFLKKIPPGAPVISTFEFLPELSNRKNLHTFYVAWVGSNPLSSKSSKYIPKDIPYGLFDWNDTFFLTATSLEPKPLLAAERFLRLNKFFKSSHLRVVEQIEQLSLLTNDRSQGFKLVETSETPFADCPRGGTPILFDNTVTLLNYSLKFEPLGERLLARMTLYWQVENPPASLYQIHLRLRNNDKELIRWTRLIGYGLYPSLLWKKGTYLKENATFLLKDWPSQGTQLQIGVYDLYDKIYVSLKGVPRRGTYVPLGTFTRRSHETKN